MEVIEEPTIQGIVESVKVSAVNVEESVLLTETSCYTSNGIAESTNPNEPTDAVYAVTSSISTNSEITDENVSALQVDIPTASDAVDAAGLTFASLPPQEEMLVDMKTDATEEHLFTDIKTDELTEEVIQTSESILCSEGPSVIVDVVDTTSDTVTLRTEILVEKSDYIEIPVTNDIITTEHDNDHMLSELEQGIELSEVLRSSDNADNGENNNIAGGDEVFNKEELLDILQGNDEIPVSNDVSGIDKETKKLIETEIALKQLSRLSRKRNTRKSPTENKTLGKPRKKKGVKSKTTDKSVENTNFTTENSGIQEESVNKTEEEVLEAPEIAEKKINDSIVNVLVKDWDDDEPTEPEQPNELLAESDKLLETTDELVKSQVSVTSQDVTSNKTSIDSPASEAQTNQSKSGDENHPQKRLGRVIKKKVIFDPDNPDTFTKGKIKKEPPTEKEQPPPKKSKPEQTPQRAKSKSPVSKLQWKKPTPKSNSNKQNKRLTEVDKLLMDEGAVNMIYQLTPEAPKGRKNMRTKAEFIKKIQSSTPDSKEMKFRERKKELRPEEGEAKKILVGKPRSSLSNSVKSPTVSEDFENHSADDSIIYRRHSSSSYSSTCMSPRRLSDVDVAAVQMAARAVTHSSDAPTEPDLAAKEEPLNASADVFMTEAGSASNDMINKNDCLSIKEKLNTKLSLVLNKKKKDITKPHKPPKQKKVLKNSSADIVITKVEDNVGFKHVSINVDHRLAEICIRQTGSNYSVGVLKELAQAMLLIDGKPDVSVTLLTSECGTLCSDIVLKPLLGDNMEIRINYAHEIAEAVRSLLCAVERHSKLVVSAVWGACSSVALAVVALSDVALATEHATFALSSPPLPGVAAVTTRCPRLLQSLVTDLVVFGRQLSAGEALQGGLVSRCVPAAGLLRAVARELANQPVQSILLQKQLLNLKKSSESESTFLSGLEKERDLLVEYWTSMEGQDLIRTVLNS